ncbi:MAG: DegV family protein [Clostridia bacterium]|nr:DegV family protein [Clostridia bacterium]
MKKYVIIADSTCDLDADILKQYDIDYAKMGYVVDEKEYPAALEWDVISANEYYNMMRSGKKIRTLQVSGETFKEKFNYYIEQNVDILYIGCSSALSGSVNLGAIIARDLMAEHPEVTIRVIDTKISSLGQGHLVLTAARMRDEGKTLEEVAEYIESIKLTVNQFGTVDSMEYLKRAGRIKASKAFFGNLFGIKPIIISDVIGQNYAVKKVKGSYNSKLEIAKSVAECVIDSENQTLYISHADCIEEANVLRQEILKLAKFKDVYVNYIGPIVGASVGPGTLIAYCVGKEVTIEGKE